MARKKEIKSIKDVRPQVQNANRHTQRGMVLLEDSIHSDGWIGALTVAADGETFDGSARVEVAGGNGFAEPIIVRSKGDRPIIHIREDIPNAKDPRAKRLGIAANRIAQVNLDFDPAILDSLKGEIELGRYFFDDELDALLASVNQNGNGSGGEDPGAQIDRAEELQKKWKVKRGQIWEVGRHRVMCGDSSNQADIDALINRNWSHGVCTDPPYDLKGRQVRDVLEMFADIAIVLCSDSLAFDLARFWTYALDLIFHHRQPRMFPGKTRPLYVHSHCLVVKRDKSIKTGWISPEIGFKSIIECEKEYEDHEMVHGKSAELFEKMLSGFEWKVVADPFLGTGASLLACEASGRQMLGMELEPKTMSVALERFERAGLEPRLLESASTGSRIRQAGKVANPS